ncbi:MAG: MATE family efflux transporter [Rikenellaceae bacterium]
MNNINKEEFLATKPMLPLILRMAIPGVVAQLINLLYNVVDRIFIGHIPDIGTNALAGVGVTASIIMVITGFSMMVGMGGAPLASIALGKGDYKKAGLFLGNGTTLLILFALLCSLLTYLFMEPILLLSGASEHTLPYGTNYLSIYLLGTPFVLLSLGLNSFITLQGRPTVAMIAVAIGAAINIVLDYVFISVYGFGVAGAASATVISQGFSALWTVGFLLSKKASLPIKIESMKLNKRVVVSTLSLGVSPFIMSITEAIVGFVLGASLRVYGDIHLSSMAIMQSALMFANTPITGFAQGFMPIMSFNLGRGNSQRIKECFKISLVIVATFNLVLVLSMILLPEYVALIFTSDPELIANVGEVMPVFFIGMTLFGIQRVCQSSFIALGQVKISIFIALLRKIILLVPLALLLPLLWGVWGIYLSEAISDSVAAICCITIFIIVFPKILSKKA